MAEDRNRWLLLPRPVRQLPADLAAIVLLIAVTNVAVFIPGINETPLRLIFGLPFVLFASGYTFIAALFPEASVSVDESDTETSASEWETVDGRPWLLGRGNIDRIERIALSFGLSIAIVPLIGLALNFTPLGIRLAPVVLSISAFTLGTASVAAVRRWQLPAEERFRIQYETWFTDIQAELFEAETRIDGALNILLVIALLLAVSSVGYAVLVPDPGESYTEFYVLTENETGGLVADDYPTNFTQGESKPLILGIENHEHEQMEYTVVAELQNVRVVNNSTTVLDQEELRQFSLTIGSNETWRQLYNVTPSMTGDPLRLTYLLYRGEPPANPTIENSYRELHLWVNVSAPAQLSLQHRVASTE